MADTEKEQQISAELEAALDRRDDLYNDPLSAATELGPEYQAESLNDQESITENFQDKADPLYAAQVADLDKDDLERAEGTDDGSRMISEDGNRHDMHPPNDMRADVERASFNERMARDDVPSPDLDEALKRRDDLYENTSEFDNDQGSGSNYNDEYEPR